MAKVAKTAFCVVALLVLLALGIASLYNVNAHDRTERMREGASEADATLSDSLPGTQVLLAPYRAANTLLDVRYFPSEKIYVLPNGHMLKIQSRQSAAGCADNTVQLARFCEDRGINFEYIVFPAKPEYDAELLDVGVAGRRNENADELVRLLEENGILCHDMRDQYHDDFYSHFYMTDHHWTTETGLEATRQVIAWLDEDFGYSFDAGRIDDSQLVRTVYPDSYIGELGLDQYGPFGPVEDFVVIEPAYEANLRYQNPQQGIDVIGGFDILFDDTHMQDLDRTPTINRYYYYLGGNYSGVELTNYDITEGNVLIIKDSFSNVVAPFFALTCNHVVLWDMREDPCIYEYLEQHPEIETVVVMYNAGSCANPDYHDFR